MTSNLRQCLKHPSIRNLFETQLQLNRLVHPVFVTNVGSDSAIEGFGNYKHFGKGQLSNYDSLRKSLYSLADRGLRHVMLFGSVNEKDRCGSLADSTKLSPVVSAIREIRKDRNLDGLAIHADICLCAYTSDGHCGITHSSESRSCESKQMGAGPLGSSHCKWDVVRIDYEKTLKRLGEVSVAYGDAGADIVVPSDMMDGRVSAIRSALDAAGHDSVAIMPHSSKKASSLYKLFRHAAATSLKGDRKSYQHPPSDKTMFIRAVERDVAEGADIVLVKPALFYTDLIKQAKEKLSGNHGRPVAAYVVSGEYFMLREYGNAFGCLKETVYEAHESLFRAGADLVVTYFAEEIITDKL